jgi:hypothetical protein
MSTAGAIAGASLELQEFLSNLAVFRGLPVMADRCDVDTFL